MEEIGRISRGDGNRPPGMSGNVEETFFTYAELQKICVLATAECRSVLN